MGTLLYQAMSNRNIAAAIRILEEGSNRPGLDGMPPSQLREYWRINGAGLRERVVTGRYRPQPVEVFEILGRSGKTRVLAHYSAIDRLIQRALHQQMERVLVPRFSDFSFAYRKGKGTRHAAALAVEYANSGDDWIAELDFRRCFDSIPHAKLLERVDEAFSEPMLTELVARYLRADVVRQGERYVKKKGVVQGSPISPMLANLYLDLLDRHCEAAGYRFLRFADDVSAFASTFASASAILADLAEFSGSVLGLPVNDEKTGVYPVVGRRILGYVMTEADGVIEARRHSRRPRRHTDRWESSSLIERDGTYHLTGSGILTRRDHALLFENNEIRAPIPVEMTDCVNIYSDIVFSSEFFRLAGQKNLRVNVFDAYGQCAGSFIPAEKKAINTAALAQLAAYCDPERRLAIARSIAAASIHNMRANVRHYSKRAAEPERFEQGLFVLKLAHDEIGEAASVDAVLMLEARARREYYSLVNLMLPDADFDFRRRSRRPPADPINALFSFGNTYLYNAVAREIAKTPLDVRIAFLHGSLRRHENLNLDIADIFKPLIVDRAIFSLVNLESIDEARHFEPAPKRGVYLNADGREVFLRRLRKTMASRRKIGGERLSWWAILGRELAGLRAHLTEGTEYAPYRYY